MAEIPAPGANLAAIDIGTNSVHLVVARVGEGHTFEVIDREKEQVRLGSSGGDMKELSVEAIDRGVEVLARFRRIAESNEADVTAVATSAVREAHNARLFIERAATEAGVDVRIISGFEEARLIHLGVLQALPIFDRQHLVIDIGGGSTEVVVAQRRQRLVARSLKLGAIRLTRRFFPDDAVSDRQLARAARHIDSALAPVGRELRRLDVEVAAGCSGTIETVAAMANGTLSVPRSWNGYEFARKDVRRALKVLKRCETAGERRSIVGVDPRRSDILLAGTLILERAMTVFDLTHLTVSDFALREGVLLDAIERSHGSAQHHLHDLRRASVVHLMGLCDEDPDHSAKVAELSLEVFDGLSEIMDLGGPERELLEAAALLCNVGLFVSHAQHHKHSYYVIRNSEHLLGFTDHEIELIALIARYHRKSAPKMGHVEYAALPEADREMVRVLAGILRIGLALDRTHSGAVEGIEIEVKSKVVRIVVRPEPGAEVELELYTADDRRGLLESTTGRRIELSAAPDPVAAAQETAGA